MQASVANPPKSGVSIEVDDGWKVARFHLRAHNKSDADHLLGEADDAG
jgi:hypothetical protein